MNKLIFAGVGAAALALSGCATTMNDDMASDSIAYVDGAAMYPSKTIVENAMNSPIHTTLVAAVKQAGLVDTLSGTGPFTVFAPTDAAFAKVPKAMLDSAMMDSNRPLLTKILTYHVVPGRVTAADLMQRIKAGGGKAMLTTVQGEQLTASMMGNMVMLTGKNGSMSHVTQADVMQSNGIIHVVDGVLTPTM
ncbi:fasciclin domain-containing protein [Qipengyuania sp.]|uniref:fasciclin domain-containing protein n=1 Tax=Qipengyuania sp. TaxID=2004515 RepID=UPI0035C82E11